MRSSRTPGDLASIRNRSDRLRLCRKPPVIAKVPETNEVFCELAMTMHVRELDQAAGASEDRELADDELSHVFVGVKDSHDRYSNP